MKSLRNTFLCFVFLSINFYKSNACTTAIVSGRFTEDGRPLLLKHRDSGFIQNKLMYFNDGKYSFIGLVNSVDSLGKEVWSGCNIAGFAIMNSASYNLKPGDDTTKLVDQEGVIMKKALQTCETIDDFKQLLEKWDKPMGVEANFGVIDAHGGAAYFECNNFSFTMIDANDSEAAPLGYLIRTNYSFTGEDDEGYGYIRYLTAENLFYQAKASNNLNYKFILQKVSRSLNHSLTKVDLLVDYKPTVSARLFVPFEDFIPRNSSVTSMVVHGVKPGEPPKQATIWTILGFPLTSVAIPAWVETGEQLPKILLEDETGKAPLCELSLKLKEKCFPIKRGSGYKYINLSALFNEEGIGIMQQLKIVEDELIEKTKEKINKWRKLGHIPSEEAKNFYENINLTIEKRMMETILKMEKTW